VAKKFIEIIVIESCWDCPNEVFIPGGYKCSETNKKLKDPNVIPKWCPLKDYEKTN
jgi:hypothetical protein